MHSWYQKIWRFFSHPYAFFEEAIDKGDPTPATLIFLLTFISTYYGWWLLGGGRLSLIHLLINMSIALLTYPVAVLLIYLVCRLLVQENHLRSFFAVWGFSYLPTFFFFLLNIAMQSLAGLTWFTQIFSQPLLMLILWTGILLIFLWKILLLTITLRLAGNLNLRQIILAFLILMVIMGIYWVTTFDLGWLKIPFI